MIDEKAWYGTCTYCLEPGNIVKRTIFAQFCDLCMVSEEESLKRRRAAIHKYVREKAAKP